jgi:hypothetical protein
VDQINVLEPQMQALSDEELRAKTVEFKRRVAGGESLEAILPEAFAVRRREGGGGAALRALRKARQLRLCPASCCPARRSPARPAALGAAGAAQPRPAPSQALAVRTASADGSTAPGPGQALAQARLRCLTPSPPPPCLSGGAGGLQARAGPAPL